MGEIYSSVAQGKRFRRQDDRTTFTTDNLVMILLNHYLRG
jgi:hypothetical protein